MVSSTTLITLGYLIQISQEKDVNLGLLLKTEPLEDNSEQAVDIMTPEECAKKITGVYVGVISTAQEISDTVKVPLDAFLTESLQAELPEEPSEHPVVQAIVSKFFECLTETYKQVNLDLAERFWTVICAPYVKALNFWYKV